MKTFFVVCLALAAVADPDAQLLLNSPFYSGLTLQQPLAVQQPLTYSVLPQTKYVAVEEKKVDDVVEVAAEPEPITVEKVEAPKVAVYAAAPQQVLPYAAYPYSAYPYATPVVQPQQQVVVPKYFAKNGAVEHIVVKREAEAEADAQLIYSTAAYNPYMYSAQPAVYAAQPAVYAAQPAIYAAQPAVYAAQAKTYANDFNPFTANYAGKGMYVADSVGARHVAKREATEEKKNVFAPWAQLNAGTPARSFELNGQRLYKREAEAEPQYLAYGSNFYSNPLWNVSPYTSAYSYGYGYPTYSGVRYF